VKHGESEEQAYAEAEMTFHSIKGTTNLRRIQDKQNIHRRGSLVEII